MNNASQQAYVTKVYLRIEHPNDEVSMQRVAARTKVTPIKQILLATLKICGAIWAVKPLKNNL